MTIFPTHILVEPGSPGHLDVAPQRGLRASETRLAERGTQRKDGATALFWCGVMAIVLQFTVTNNLLNAAGIGLAMKVHPSSVIVALCVAYATLRHGAMFRQQFRQTPGLLMFVITIPVLGLYSVSLNGYSGSAVFIETFWSAGLLALLLEPASDTQKRMLARLIMAVCALNVLVGLYESLTHSNWFPMVYDPDVKVLEDEVDFRANAFYPHPLTASLVTSMALFMLYNMRLRIIVAAPVFSLMLIGLLAFGGRTALAVTVMMSALLVLYRLLAGIVRRSLGWNFLLTIACAAVLIPVLITFIVTQTTIADRIIDTLYYDDSAAVRVTQWTALNYLSLKNWLFGMSAADLLAVKYQIGLGGADTDIENFWLLLFLNLGGIGFLLFILAFAGFLIHLARYSRSLNGWLLMISALIIDSGSNSLGVKSNDLFLEAAFLIAMAGSNTIMRPRVSRFVAKGFPSARPRVHNGLTQLPAAQYALNRALAAKPVR